MTQVSSGTDARAALALRDQADHIRLAVETQHARCTAELIPNGLKDPAWRLGLIGRITDAQLMVLMLGRLARLARRVPATPALQEAIARFDDIVPHVTELRDTDEHFDAYGAGKGWRQKQGEPPYRWGFMHVAGELYLSYGPYRMNSTEALAAGQLLHRAIRAAIDPAAERDREGGGDIIFPNP
jgi:hypothetical protein